MLRTEQISPSREITLRASSCSIKPLQMVSSNRAPLSPEVVCFNSPSNSSVVSGVDAAPLEETAGAGTGSAKDIPQ